MTVPFGELFEQQNLNHELETAHEISEPVRQQLERFARQVAAGYVAMAGGLDQPMPEQQIPLLRSLLLYLLSRLSVNRSDQLLQLVQQGATIGRAQAAEISQTVLPLAGGISRELLQAAQQMDERANEQLQNAAHFATTARLNNWDDTLQVIAKANRAANTTDKTARWAANRAITDAIRQAARDMTDLMPQLLWVAERDACLHCLAYNGQLADPEGWFHGGLTFYINPGGERKPLNHGPLPGPPAHPNCRCRLQLWFGSELPGQPGDVPAALRRESQRAVLRGFSGSDSEPARLRAADALLQQAGRLVLGRSVIARARRDVEAGEFISQQRVLRD